MKCELLKTNIAWGEVYTPRTDFLVYWWVKNIGTARWEMDDIIFYFVGGDRMHNLDRDETFILGPVTRNDRIKLRVRLMAPKQPGTYSSTWGLRRSNKKEPFCTFSVTITVVKK